MNQIVNTYNPAKADNLTPEEVAAMPSLTKAEIEALADAYPNTPTSNNYLKLYDDRVPADKQVGQLSSWKNLKDLYDIGETHFHAVGFRGKTIPVVTVTAGNPTGETFVDLTQSQAATAAGIKPPVQTDGLKGEGQEGAVNALGSNSYLPPVTKAEEQSVDLSSAPADNGGAATGDTAANGEGDKADDLGDEEEDLEGDKTGDTVPAGTIPLTIDVLIAQYTNAVQSKAHKNIIKGIAKQIKEAGGTVPEITA